MKSARRKAQHGETLRYVGHGIRRHAAERSPTVERRSHACKLRHIEIRSSIYMFRSAAGVAHLEHPGWSKGVLGVQVPAISQWSGYLRIHGRQCECRGWSPEE